MKIELLRCSSIMSTSPCDVILFELPHIVVVVIRQKEMNFMETFERAKILLLLVRIE